MYLCFKFLPATCLAGILVLASCNPQEDESRDNTLFKLLSSEQTHIDFNNYIAENERANIMAYQYFYNGGGVSVGDLNNDGLDDIYLSGNMTPAKLYLNKGNMQFEDITAAAGISEEGLTTWKTGVTMADVNGDGKLDIYQCFSGGLPAPNRQNRLYINQGNDPQGRPQFKESAAAYGLADDSYSTQAVFFDYDRDNDLDMFLLNHNPKVFTTLEESSAPQVLSSPAPQIKVKLYQNQDGHFSDISEQAGLINTAFTYGLGAGIADLNQDGWPDIYISNDYSAPDYLYLNNHDGTFSDHLGEQLRHTSLYSMGNEAADINNDGLVDLLTLDMLPEDNHRQKQLFAPDNYEYYNLRLKLGFHHQDMRNMLQINNGNGTFSEVGQLSGISNTDWSWAPLFADYDNDGWKDLFITNGYLRDYTDMDFLKFKGDYLRMTDPSQIKANILGLIDNIPSSNVKNYIFKNNGDLTFSNKGATWGIDQASNSNGAAYADLDNDGDLDLVINNINLPAFVYQNQSDTRSENQYLKIKLEGKSPNTLGVGARIWLYSQGKTQYAEQNPSRGYQSSVSPVLHFGLGHDQPIDSLRVVWNDGLQQTLRNPKSNQLLVLKQDDARSLTVPSIPVKTIFGKVASPIPYKQAINTINDFKRQPLLTNPLSFSGPCMTKGDVNGDGLEDIFIGGEAGQAGQLYLQRSNGSFQLKNLPVLNQDKASEDTDALIFDANGDGHPDLYVASGGYGDFTAADSRLQDRLYLNDGKANFSRASQHLPVMLSSSSCVRSADFNGDGHPDLFVGSRVIPGSYPEAPESYLLINDGKGHFSDQIKSIAPQLQHAGMVTDALWADLNNDKRPDLIVVGEWMPVTLLINQNGKLSNQTKQYFGKSYTGWWNKILYEDLNGDGKPDLLLGNAGLNSQCKASDAQPAEMYYKDFDDNGSIDPIFCFYIQGKSYPSVTRDELLDQMSMMRGRFPDYKGYADNTMKDIFKPEELQGAKKLSVNQLKTTLFLNQNGKFKESDLPIEAQYSPVYTISSFDYDHDGRKDVLLCGNISRARLKFGDSDANYGVLLHNDGKGRFSYVPQYRSGFNLRGDVRSVVQVNDQLLFGINQGSLQAYTLQ